MRVKKTKKFDFILTACFLFACTICGIGYAESADTENTDGVGAIISPVNNKSNTPDSDLITQADASNTVNAVAKGLNPKNTILSSLFYCYENAQTDLTKPAFFYTVDGDSVVVTSPVIPGVWKAVIEPGDSVGEFVAVYADLGSHPFRLEFTNFGQELYALQEENRLAGCFQEGAAHEAALHRFKLNTPATGSFLCSVFDGSANTSSTVSIELLEGKRYRISGKTGQMNWNQITTGASSVVVFLTGPLQGKEASYHEDPSTGLQSLQFTDSNSKVFLDGSSVSSSSYGALCNQLSEPKPYKKYGKSPAPIASKPDTFIKGTYAVDVSFATNNRLSAGVEYVKFTPEGYFYLGEPIDGDTDCTRTHPNGLPLCQQYQFDDNALFSVEPWGTKYDLWGEPDSTFISVGKNGLLKSIESYPAEVLSPVNREDVVGVWESQEVYSTGVSACIVGHCQSSIIDRSLEFKKDGRFRYSLNGESSFFFNTGLSTTSSKGSEEDGTTGTYEIMNNQITLTEADGRITKLPVHIFNEGALAVGPTQYYRQ